MDVPTSSQHPGTDEQSSIRQSQQLSQQQLQLPPPQTNMAHTPALGTTDFGSTNAHKYTLSTCATTASGPSTSQTWVSGPGTGQLSTLQENTSYTSRGASESQQQMTTAFTSSQTAQFGETVTSSTARSVGAQVNQSGQWNFEAEANMADAFGQQSSMTGGQQAATQIRQTQSSSQMTSVEASQGHTITSSNGQQVGGATTQWTSTAPEITASEYFSSVQSQSNAPKTKTALTSFTSGGSSAVPQQQMAKIDEKAPSAMDYYDRALDGVNAAIAIGGVGVNTTTTTSMSTNTGHGVNIVDSQQQGGSVQNRRVVTGEPREVSVRTIRTQLDYDNQKVSENVVRREYGEMRVISTQERREDARMYVKSERFITHEVKVPKRVTREEITERTVVEQEKKIVEEIVQEACTVKERIVEWARPRVVEKVVEQPETVYQETVINVTETIQKPVVKQQEKQIVEERVVEVPVIVPREVPYDVVDIQERVIPHEVIKYVDDIRTEERITEKVVPQYVDVPTPNYTEKEITVDVHREIPVCVEAEIVCELKVPEIRPRYKKIAYPVYLPKFIEVPMALDLMTESLHSESAEFVSKINGFTKTAASLCDIENLASNIMRVDHGATAANLMSTNNLQAAVMKVWNKGLFEAGEGGAAAGIGMMNEQYVSQYHSTGAAASSAHYMSSSYAASSQNYKTDISHPPILAVS